MQTWNAADYEKNGRFVADLAGGVLDLLAPKAGEDILDLGCGDGALTLKIMESDARVIGVDGSVEMMQAAHARGVDARLLDAQKLPFEQAFDAVFSNAALHWMPDQDAVLRGLHAALRSGGRFVAECGGHGNIAAIRTALQAVMAQFGVDAEGSSGNSYFTAEEYAEKLRAHGFRVETIALIPRPTYLRTGMDGWLRTFRTALLNTLQADDREAAIAQACALLQPALCTRKGEWFADYVRLRFMAFAE